MLGHHRFMLSAIYSLSGCKNTGRVASATTKEVYEISLGFCFIAAATAVAFIALGQANLQTKPSPRRRASPTPSTLVTIWTRRSRFTAKYSASTACPRIFQTPPCRYSPTLPA